MHEGRNEGGMEYRNDDMATAAADAGGVCPTRTRRSAAGERRVRVWSYRVGSVLAEGACWYCAVPLVFSDPWHVEHVVPQRQGGSDALENLRVSCPGCNMRKGGRTPDGYRNGVLRRWDKSLLAALRTLTEMGWYAVDLNHEDVASWDPREIRALAEQLRELRAYVHQEPRLLRFAYELPWAEDAR
jgi:5-methylcytosine-specific restriction endonuclease McrA